MRGSPAPGRDAVTERDFHHLWLSEGFASYFDLVAGAALDGDSVLARGMGDDAREVMRSPVVDRPVLDTAVADLTTFHLPDVTLEFRDGPRIVARRTIEVSAARQRLAVDVPAPPTAVRVDPDGRLLLAAAVRRGPRAP